MSEREHVQQGFRQYREILKGEYFVVGGDCSQGGNDYNFTHFMSVTKKDIPLVYEKRGVAADQTDDLFRALNDLYQITGVPALVALERQNGGASEMGRLDKWNVHHHYQVFVMPQFGNKKERDKDEESNKFGWDTSSLTRPIMIGALKKAYDSRQFGIYDERTHTQMGTFIINERTGKPEADKGYHDDGVMSLAITNQLYILCPVPELVSDDEQRTETPEWVNRMPAWSGNRFTKRISTKHYHD